MRILTALTTLLLLSACGSPARGFTPVQPQRALNSMSAMTPQRALSRAPRAVATISVKEARDWLADPNASWKLLDVRTPEEFAEGRLTGSTLMNFNAPDFREQLLKLDRNQPYIIYCRSGARSAKALAMMRELGFRNAYDIQGGILAWQAAGYPVTHVVR